MAEKHGGTKFGPWLDDVADMVSFGLCPSVLIILKGNLELPSIIFGIFYFMAIGFRLWRFLVRDKHDLTLPEGFFNGLPSPAGAMVALGACLFWNNLWIIGAVILLTSYLLVSHIRFVHFGRVILRRFSRTFIVLFGFIVVFTIAYLIKARDSQLLGAALLAGFIIYVITSSKITIGKIA
jgi:CDP-diacylglycerol--serine O-phosphatidyltransferase